MLFVVPRDAGNSWQPVFALNPSWYPPVGGILVHARVYPKINLGKPEQKQIISIQTVSKSMPLSKIIIYYVLLSVEF